MDRIVKDLQGQVERKDKQTGQLQEDVGRLRDKCDKLLSTIDELQSSESSNQLSARRAERELREEREKNLRLEKELEAWKSLKGSGPGSAAASLAGSIRRMGTTATWRSATAPGGVDEMGVMVEVPKRKSSISRAPSLTKGFL